MRGVPRARLWWWARVVVLAGVGAGIALALAARVPASVGPFETTFSATPAWGGDTRVRLAPLGTIALDTHRGPVDIEVRVDELRLADAEDIARDPGLLEDLEDDLARDVRRGLHHLVRRILVLAAIGGALGGLVAITSWRGLLAGAVVGVLLAGATMAFAATTWRAGALAEPRYTGLLTVAPRAVGDAQSVVERFGEYRAQLADLVGNVSTLYRAAQNLPTAPMSDRTIRVLHVSDVHLNPQAFDLMEQLADAFDVAVVVDSGDMTDWGTEPESDLVRRIRRIRVPYLFVRGNHDSGTTEAAIAAQPNAVVLDGRGTTVAGLRFFGVGDPRFTPDKTEEVDVESEREIARAYAPTVARMLRASRPAPDVLVVHDARLAEESGDLVPLVLSGHMHRHSLRTIGDATVLVQGSTGGAGLRMLQGEYPQPLTASVLYFDPDTRLLVAYDQVTVQAISAEVRIERHVVAKPADEPDEPDEPDDESDGPVTGDAARRATLPASRVRPRASRGRARRPASHPRRHLVPAGSTP